MGSGGALDRGAKSLEALEILGPAYGVHSKGAGKERKMRERWRARPIQVVPPPTVMQCGAWTSGIGHGECHGAITMWGTWAESDGKRMPVPSSQELELKSDWDWRWSRIVGAPTQRNHSTIWVDHAQERLARSSQSLTNFGNSSGKPTV